MEYPAKPKRSRHSTTTVDEVARTQMRWYFCTHGLSHYDRRSRECFLPLLLLLQLL